MGDEPAGGDASLSQAVCVGILVIAPMASPSSDERRMIEQLRRPRVFIPNEVLTASLPNRLFVPLEAVASDDSVTFVHASSL